MSAPSRSTDAVPGSAQCEAGLRPGPLHGYTLRADGPTQVREQCHRILASLGATIGGPVRAALRRDRTVELPTAGATLPEGTEGYAQALSLAIETTVSARHDRGRRSLDPAVALERLWAPAVLGRGSWQRPSEPVPCSGGAICADLAAGDDRARFADLVDLGPYPSSEALAEAAQLWRLAVTPYRRPPTTRAEFATDLADRGPPITGVGWPSWTVPSTGAAGIDSNPRSASSPRPDPNGPSSCRLSLGEPSLCEPDRLPADDGCRLPLAGVTVLDLSIMWAGPLATRILCDLGASVHRIEPSCRLDGMRQDPGGLFAHLARGKVRHDLDLREADQRRTFDELVAESDLVLDAFSPRVLPNLSITQSDLRVDRPDLLTISMPAFGPTSRCRHWVAYGTGVHAMSGLGWQGARPEAPPISYPDPIAGLTAALAAVALILERDHANGDRPRGPVEVPLAASIGPLLSGEIAP